MAVAGLPVRAPLIARAPRASLSPAATPSAPPRGSHRRRGRSQRLPGAAAAAPAAADRGRRPPLTRRRSLPPAPTCSISHPPRSWGPKLEETAYKARYRLYLSEQTDGSEPNKLLVCTADVMRPRVASAEVTTSWNEYSRSAFVREHKVLFHPGEVNKIRELPQAPQARVCRAPHASMPAPRSRATPRC